MIPTQIHDTLWTGETSRELRRHPAAVREMQVYLLTCPDRNPYGLYLLETDTIGHRIGARDVSPEQCLEILQGLGFCRWDARSRWVWVIEMARIQFNAPLAATDYRVVATQKWYRGCLRNPFLGPWFDRYVRDFHLLSGKVPCERREHERESEVMADSGKPLSAPPVASPIEAPPDRGSAMPLCTESLGFDLSSQVVEEKKDLLVQIDPARARASKAEIEAWFEQVWDIYPNGHQKADALKELVDKIRPTRALLATIRASVVAHLRSRQWTKDGGDYVPRFVNFLKKQKWLDEPDREATGPVLTARTAQNVTAARNFAERGDDDGE
jgi:hypothetical protein